MKSSIFLFKVVFSLSLLLVMFEIVTAILGEPLHDFNRPVFLAFVISTTITFFFALIAAVWEEIQ